MKLLVSALLALILVGLGGSSRSDGRVPRRENAPAQLAHALQCKLELRGRSGAARREARSRAVAAYLAVPSYFPAERMIAAEACFRAGELLRAGGETRRALAEFARAGRFGRGTTFDDRAGIEIGHIHRREREWMAALSAYEEVLARADTWPCYRDRATWWAGRVHMELGRPRDASRCWERVAREGASPLIRIRAFDSWAQRSIDESDLEGAAGILALCRSSLRDVGLEETELGERVRGAMERMHSVTRLARAIEERARRLKEGAEQARGARGVREIPPIPSVRIVQPSVSGIGFCRVCPGPGYD
jgi:hypothetical protein